jgi:outer membrane protein OmpA-like peptidoglycan-associated protein
VPAGVAARGAGVADARGGESLNWNPAGMVNQPYESLAMTHFSGLVDTAYEQLEGYVPEFLGGAWGVRLFYDSTYNFTEINQAGDSVGNLENYDLLLHLAHARLLAPGLTAGVGAKFFESALAGYYSRGAALDLGLRYAPAESSWAVGCTLANLGSKTAFDQEADQLPLSLNAGLAWTWQMAAGQQVKILGDVIAPLAGDEAAYPLLGLEYALRDFMVLRGGYRWENELGGFSVGAGLRWSRWGVDYAFQPYGTLGNNHRFTLTYAFKPLPAAAAEAAVAPSPAPAPEAATVTEAQIQEPRLRALTASPRELESVVSFQVPPAAAGEQVRVLEIQNSRAQVVKKIHLSAGSTAELRWNGRDENGSLVSSQEHYSYRWEAPGQTVPAVALPQVLPVLKLCFADGTVLEPQANFEILSQPQAKSWNLAIFAQSSGDVVRSFEGTGPLPSSLVWEGQIAGQAWAPTQEQYRFHLSLTDEYGREVTVADAIHAIKARRVESSARKQCLLIPEILFDFNSAVLKPEMLDKITAAAQVLQRHPGRATAVCEGHADEIGSAEYNQVISRQRATMVAAFLADSLGVPKEALFVQGFGKNRPEDPASTEEARARNRRVEIRITLPGN